MAGVNCSIIKYLTYLFFFTTVICDISVEEKDKFLNGFVNYLNNLPSQSLVYNEGVLLNAQKWDENLYKIQVRIKASDQHNVDSTKILKCTCTIQDFGDQGVTIPNNDYQCQEVADDEINSSVNLEEVITVTSSSTTEATDTEKHEPVQLLNEVQTNTAATSGEQFIAIPRPRPSAPCIGCSHHVDPEASGVKELAELGVKQLDRHEPNIRHSLNTVYSVERQVQVVNGVRYILKMSIDYNNCTETESESCLFSKICKISVLEKPWAKLPDGSKYRAIVANNCTEEWLFGDNGEVISNDFNKNKENNEIDINPFNHKHGKSDDIPQSTPDYDKIANTGSADDILKAIHNLDVQATHHDEKSLTEDELKNLERQIVPHDQFLQTSPKSIETSTSKENNDEHVQQHVVKTIQSVKQAEEDMSTFDEHKNEESTTSGTLNEDKKKAIDDLINFFNYAGFDSKSVDTNNPRIKRSFDYDLHVMSVAEKFQKIKRNVDNAKYIYNLAQVMVDNLNEMDLEVKTRILKDVITAEEENDNNQRFIYLQARVLIPCDKADCGNKENIKICNGIIDNSNPQSPQVISAFCYDEDKSKLTIGKVEWVPLDDPILLELAKVAIKRMESESLNNNAIKIQKIVHANVQKVSGTLTKISMVLVDTNCSKNMHLATRVNCTVLEHLEPRICEVIIHEKYWLKERKITYSCTPIPTDEKFSDVKISLKKNTKDPKIQEMVEQALQYLELQSNRNEKQKVVNIRSISTQLVAGLLTDIEFVVGYTTCPNDVEVNAKNCKLLKNEPLRMCRTQVWDRPWLEDDRQVNVTCDDSVNIESNEISRTRKKRSTNFVGGPVLRDKLDPKYKLLAEESLNKYSQTVSRPDSSPEYAVLEIERVTVQVVSGTLTEIDFQIIPKGEQPSSTNSNIVHCNSKIWERPWLNDKNIDVTCDLNNKKGLLPVIGGRMLNIDSPNKYLEITDTKSMSKRKLTTVKEHDPTDLRYEKLAKESLQKFLKIYNGTQHHKLIKVDKVTSRVVSGKLFEIDFKISPTNCQLNSSGYPTLANCEVRNFDDIISCHSEVWEQPWLRKKDIDVMCEMPVTIGKRVKRAFVGGQNIEDPNNLEYRKLATESLHKYQNLKGSKYYHKVLDVTHVTSQVVSGRKYIIEYTASQTTCSIKEKDKTNCKPIDDTILNCNTQIWSRPWLKQKDIKVSCHSKVETNKKERRNITIPVDISDNSSDNYKTLAEETLRKFESLSKTKYLHKVIKLHNITEQIVEGIITNIEYSASPTTCLIVETESQANCKLEKSAISLLCRAEVWDRSWIQKRDIKVKCENPEEINDKAKFSDLELDVEEREKRQIRPDEGEIDDETLFYYADRAIKHINDNSDTHNLYKLITIYASQKSMHMGALLVRMYIETAMTYCLREENDVDINKCDEIDGLNNRLCLVKLWPSPIDELDVHHVNVICDDEQDFQSVTGLTIVPFVNAALKELERHPGIHYKLVHQGVPYIVPSLDSNTPIKMSFLAVSTNCTKDVDIEKNRMQCFADRSRGLRNCHAFIWLVPNSRKVLQIDAACKPPPKNLKKRSISVESTNVTADDLAIQKLVQESLEKLEMMSLHRYKQKVVQINSYSTKITTRRVTTIDFDVGYTSCLKYEWVENLANCVFLDYLPRRHCVAQVYESLWVQRGHSIDVDCQDDETPLEPHIEYESASYTMPLANIALRHIEAKYPHPQKQKVVRIFALEKQMIAGVHYKMKIEVGLTNCLALTTKNDNCTLIKNVALNKFCRVNIWIRPWTDHPPNYRVSCDYQDGATAEVYHMLQAETLFFDFLTTYKPDYMNDHSKISSRFQIFRENIRKIHELNVHEQGTATYGVTRFTDLTYDEFKSRYLGLNPSLRDQNQIPMSHAAIPDVDIPETFDWRDREAVTEVKDQGSCGSCWAFSVTGNIEGQWKLRTGKLVSLSEQELVDCDKLDNGCNGGLPDNAYRAIEQLGGLEAETDYPYEGEDDKCAYNKSLSRVQIKGAVNITSNETDMAKWLFKNGPISIGINANAMQFYVGGISHPWKMLCNPSNLDHGVLIVGYGVKDYPLFKKRLPYWTVKNSWGKGWGEQGYYRVYRGDGTCGLNQMASSSVV